MISLLIQEPLGIAKLYPLSFPQFETSTNCLNVSSASFLGCFVTSGPKKSLAAPGGIHNSEYISWNFSPNYSFLIHSLSMFFNSLTSDHTCLSRLISCHSFLSHKPTIFRSLQTACNPWKTDALPYLLTLTNAIPKVLNACLPFIM